MDKGFRFQSRLNYSVNEIQRMSQRTREEFYKQDKNELFMQIRNLPAEEIARAHEALVKKWRL